MIGWIKLDRALCHHWIAQNPDSLAVWVRLLLEANFEKKTRLFNGSKITLDRGQLIFGLNAFSEKTGVSISKIRRVLNMLEEEKMISRQKTNKYSIITVLSYDLYQSGDSQKAIKKQSADSQATTPKEVKELEEAKELTEYIAFEDFWFLYPNKKGKAQAEKIWKKLKVTDELYQQIVNHCTSAYKQTEQKFIPHGSTYLNNRRWEDELPDEQKIESIDDLAAEVFGSDVIEGRLL